MAGIDQELRLTAPAKINLNLAVIARRDDGYHELDTLMQKLDLADDLILRKSHVPGIKLTCSTLELANDDNLVYRAALLFCQQVGIEPSLEIVLEKNIPVAAGLGGGSSDAAAVLKGLDQLLGTGLARDDLGQIALQLGADVPFFVSELTTARARGIGERLSSAPGLAGYRVLLVNPGYAVATGWVFGEFDQLDQSRYALTTEGNPYILGRANEGGSPLVELFNDLEKVTLTKHPELARLKSDLVEAGAEASLMSGSGPTVFAVFADWKRAEVVGEIMRRQYENVYLTGLL